jgi:hypothetical protein
MQNKVEQFYSKKSEFNRSERKMRCFYIGLGFLIFLADFTLAYTNREGGALANLSLNKTLNLLVQGSLFIGLCFKEYQLEQKLKDHFPV